MSWPLQHPRINALVRFIAPLLARSSAKFSVKFVQQEPRGFVLCSTESKSYEQAIVLRWKYFRAARLGAAGLQAYVLQGGSFCTCVHHFLDLLQWYINFWNHFSFRFSTVYFYYRATLCVSAVFAVAWCLSVCQTDTFVYSIHRAKDIVKLFLDPVAPSF